MARPRIDHRVPRTHPASDMDVAHARRGALLPARSDNPTSVPLGRQWSVTSPQRSNFPGANALLGHSPLAPSESESLRNKDDAHSTELVMDDQCLRQHGSWKALGLHAHELPRQAVLT